MLRIGVLALQGAFNLHRRHLEALGAAYVEVIAPRDLDALDGLILPGGESGAMLRHIDRLGLEEALRLFLAEKHAWGICAGAILLAKKVRGPEQRSFAALDMTVERNAYGRQLDSLEEEVEGYRVAFIRAPRITQAAPGVRILARRSQPGRPGPPGGGGDPCWVESGRLMATTFHPELNLAAPSPWHRRLAQACGR